jgi:hypothetical protein
LQRWNWHGCTFYRNDRSSGQSGEPTDAKHSSTDGDQWLWTSSTVLIRRGTSIAYSLSYIRASLGSTNPLGHMGMPVDIGGEKASRNPTDIFFRT